MSPEHRRYLFVDSAIGSGVVNGLINGGLGWLATRGLVAFPVWKAPGVFPDVLATAFGVAFGTCLGAALQAKLDVARGRIIPPDVATDVLGILALQRRGLLGRAMVLGLVSMPFFAGPVLAALALSGATALPRFSFIELKTSLSAIEGALVAPFVVLSALIHRRDVRPTS